MLRKKKLFRFSFIILLLWGIFLRFYRLSYEEFWYDEIMSLYIAFNPLLHWTPPIFYLVLHYWTKIFPRDFLMTRFPVILCNLFFIYLLYLTAQKFFNEKIAVLSSLLALLSPFQLWYARELRPYSLASLLALISFYFFLGLLQGKRKYFLSFIIFSSLALYTSYFFLFFLWGEFLVLCKEKKLRLSYILAFLLIFSLFLPWYHPFKAKFLAVKSYFWLPAPDITAFKISLENFLLGYNGGKVGYIIIDIIVIYLFYFLLRNKNKLYNNSLISAIIILSSALASCFLFSKIFFPIYLDRGLIIFSALFYLIIATALEQRKNILACLLILLFYADYNFLNNKICSQKHRVGVWRRANLTPALNYLKKNGKPSDIFLLTHTHLLATFYFYYFPYKFYFIFIPGFKNEAWGYEIKERWLYYNIAKISHLLSPQTERIWVITALNVWGMEGSIGPNGKKVIQRLEEKFSLKFVKDIFPLRIYVFKVRARD